MHILIVNQHVGTPGGVGGTRHYSLARELVERGHAVTIVASSFSHMTRRDKALAPGERWKLERLDGIDFLWVRTPPYGGNTAARLWNMLMFAWRALHLAGRRLPVRPDVVIGSSPHPFAAWAGERLARRFRVPFVLEVRDLWPQTLIDLGRISPRHPLIVLMGRLERHLYRRAERIISLLPGAAAHMAAKGADPERIVWLPNGVDLAMVPVSDPAGGVPFTVMYAGTHGLSNQLDTVLDAATRLRDRGRAGLLRFRFIGDGPAKAVLERRAKLEGLSDFVSFEPAVPKAQVFARLQEADCFVMTTQDTPLYRWGISPNKLYDYMASARPVVVGCNSPYDPVTEAGAGYTIPPADSRAMAEAIARLADTPLPERIAMGQRGRAYVRAYHSMPVLGLRLEQILQDSRQSNANLPRAQRAGVVD